MFAWQATAQDESGNVVPLPVVTVWKLDGATLADIYDETGSPIPNPLTGTLEGFVQFWAAAGTYKIEGVGDGSYTEEWEVTLGSDGPWLDSVQALVNDESIVYGTGPNGVVAGGYVRTRKEMFSYQVLPSGSTDADISTAGGILLRVLKDSDGYAHIDAFNALGDGVTDETALIQAAIDRHGSILLGSGKYVVSNLTPRSSMRIKGTAGGTWGKSMLFVAGDDKSVFLIPAGSSSVHNVTLSNFQADAGGLRCTFWNQVPTNNYASTYRINNLNISNEFILIFRSTPIYWVVDDCQFGFHGNRKGGTQAFRIMVAWSTSAPINFNQIRNTKHYKCTGDGTADDAAYVLRFGAEWHFINCTAEGFNNLAIVSQREFVLVDWTGGWIEFIDHPSMFTQARDTAAPNLQGCRGTYLNDCRIYLMGSNTSLIRNISGGMAGVRGLHCGTPPTSANFRPIALPAFTAYYGGVDLGASQPGRGTLIASPPSIKITGWRNVPGGAGWSTYSPGGVSPVISGVTSDLTGESTIRVRPGDRAQAVFREIPPKMWQHLVAPYVPITFYMAGYWEVAPANGLVTLCVWNDVAVPTADNVTVTPIVDLGIGSSTTTNLRSGRLKTNLNPTSQNTLHVGFMLNPADLAVANCWWRVEAFKIFTGEQFIDFPGFD